jgi:steroid Delta-isomerase
MADHDPVTTAFAAYSEAIEEMDRDKLMAILTEDVIQIDPYPSDPNVGHEAVLAFFETTWSMAETLVMVPGRSIVGGDKGVFPFTVRTTIAGGGQIEVDVIDVIRVAEDGRISELTAFVDLVGMRSL